MKSGEEGLKGFDRFIILKAIDFVLIWISPGGFYLCFYCHALRMHV